MPPWHGRTLADSTLPRVCILYVPLRQHVVPTMTLRTLVFHSVPYIKHNAYIVRILHYYFQALKSKRSVLSVIEVISASWPRRWEVRTRAKALVEVSYSIHTLSHAFDGFFKIRRF